MFMKMRLVFILIIVLFLFLFSLYVSHSSALADESQSLSRANPFYPVPESLRLTVDFWKDVFSKYSRHNYVLHDRRHPFIVYEVVDISKVLKTTKYSRRQRNRVLTSHKAKYQKLLSRLRKLNGKTENLTDDEIRIVELFKRVPGKYSFSRATNMIRAQAGIKDRFLKGLERQQKYIDKMRAVFRKEGVPEEILALPHLESSYNPRARSKVGAVGLWQFMRSTGRLYLRINRRVDERYDPVISTRAAAKHLKASYKKLGSWPLAVMAYNYGSNGIQRAKRKLRTSSYEEIIKRYSSRSFQFASRNFYMEFLAVLEISSSPWAYFTNDELPESLQRKDEKPVLLASDNNAGVNDAAVKYEMPPVKKPEVSITVKNEESGINYNRIPENKRVEKNRTRKSNGGLKRSIEKLVTFVPKAYAMDAADEPKLAVKYGETGDHFWIKVSPITVDSGKWTEDERVADGFAVAMNRFGNAK